MSLDEAYERHRLRLSISPALNRKLEESAEALGINPTALATFAFSIGLRALAPMIHPMSVDGMQDLLKTNTDKQVTAAFSDADLPVK